MRELKSDATILTIHKYKFYDPKVINRIISEEYCWGNIGCGVSHYGKVPMRQTLSRLKRALITSFRIQQQDTVHESNLEFTVRVAFENGLQMCRAI